MYESGHSSGAEDVQAALRRLEAVLSLHEREIEGAADAEPAARAALRRHLDLMRDEASRLRQLLGC